VLEPGNRATGQHHRVRPQQGTHLAEQGIDDETEIKQKQRVVEAGERHRRAPCFRRRHAINRETRP